MDITAFIRELLFGHDCVIIPGFGGFIGNYTPARIDKVTGTFYPPVKQISFNRNLNHNDGLLIKKISASSGVNYGDARNMVEEFVSDLRKKLERGDKVVFDKIGTFINNQEGNVQFEPDPDVNYHLDSFGMESFQCFPLEGYDVRKRISGHVQKDHSGQSSLRKYLWRAAVIIPLAGAIVAVSLTTDLLKAKVESTTMNPLVNAEFEHNKAAVDRDMNVSSPETAVKVSQPAVESAVETKAEPMIQPDPEPPKTDVEAPIAEITEYYIITGSFQSGENAGKQVSLLQAEGFNPQVITSNTGFYRVCAMLCPDLATAVSKKDSVAKKFPGAWISRKK